MNIQIFGSKKDFDTKKAERYFKERGIKAQFIDMKEKGLSKGEFNSVCQAVGGYEKLISEMTGIPCRVEPRLIEQNFGKWESTPRDGKDFKKAKESFACSYEGGESMLRLAQRIYNLLDDIKAESDEKTYILVAHNGIARVVQSYFTDMTNEEYAAWGVKNCAVVRYDF